MLKIFHAFNNKTNTVTPKNCLLVSVHSSLFADVSIVYDTIWGYKTSLSLYGPDRNIFNFLNLKGKRTDMKWTLDGVAPRIRKGRMTGAGEECVSVVEVKRNIAFPLGGRERERIKLCLKISKVVINKYIMTVHHVTGAWPITNKNTDQILVALKMS